MWFYNGTMQTTILQTKLYRPVRLPDQIARPQLVARLQEGAQHKLTVIAAPAGFGKTSLVVEWLHQQPQPVAWLALDADDNEPARLLHHVIAGIDRLYPGVGAEARALLQLPQPPALATVLATLINELVSATPAIAPFVLVLDDYHLLTTPAIHEGVSYLLDHLPPQLHLILTSRSEPPLPLARLRARNQLCEIGATDLRFQDAEISAFFTTRAGISLRDADVAILAERTEGWAAALQFVLLSVQHIVEPEQLQQVIRNLSGRDRRIVDYLLTEVLAQLSAEQQHFLLHTAILARMEGELCAVVTGQSNTQAMLEAFERANLFLIALDNERRWYRYHHLFAELLRHRLVQQSGKATLSALHQRASQWFAQQGLIDEAIDHALSAEDFTRVAQLIEPVATQLLWGRGAVTRLWRWLEAIPLVTLQQFPRLLLTAVWSHLSTVRLEDAYFYLNALLALPVVDASTQAQVYTIQATISEARGEKATAHQLAHRALALLPADDAEARAVVLFSAYIVLTRDDVLTSLHPWLNEALVAAKSCGNYYIVGFVMRFLAWIAIARGELHHAFALGQETLQLAEAQRDQALLAKAFAHYVLAEIYDEWGERRAAAEHYAQGLKIGEQCQVSDIIMPGYMYYSRQLAQQGNRQALTTILDKLWVLIKKVNMPRVTADFARSTALLSLELGDLNAVAAWITTQGLTPTTMAPDLDRDSDCAILVRYRLTQHAITQDPATLAGVSDLIATVQQKAVATANHHSAIYFGTLQALTCQALGELERALHHLQTALTLAQPGGYSKSFTDFGAPMQALLQMAHQQGILPDYTQKLLTAFANQPSPNIPPAQEQFSSASQSQQAPIPNLIEPLTDRESEILHLVAAGLKNSDIAEQLIITIGTVKRHIANIYGKLGVTHRAAAIARAHELHLL